MYIVGWVGWLGFWRRKPTTRPGGIDSWRQRPTTTNGSFELGKLQVGRSQFGGFWSSLDTPTSLAIMAKKMRRINKDEKKPLFLFSKFICLKCKR